MNDLYESFNMIEPLPRPEEVRLQARCPVCGWSTVCTGKSGDIMPVAAYDLVDHFYRAHDTSITVVPWYEGSYYKVAIKCFWLQCHRDFERRVTMYNMESANRDYVGDEARSLIAEFLTHYDQEHEPLFQTVWRMGGYGDV